jgi:hypothetical protein
MVTSATGRSRPVSRVTAAAYTVIAQELALLSREVRGSRAALEELLDPDFREVGASGRLWTREETIDALLADEDVARGEPAATDFVATVLAADVVLLTYESDDGERHARRVSVWRRAGAWRVLYHQGTPRGGDR